MVLALDVFLFCTIPACFAFVPSIVSCPHTCLYHLNLHIIIVKTTWVCELEIESGRNARLHGQWVQEVLAKKAGAPDGIKTEFSSSTSVPKVRDLVLPLPKKF